MKQSYQTIGLAYLLLPDNLMKRYLPDLEPPIWGAVGIDMSLQVQANLEEIHKRIWLPDPCTNYKVVRLFYEVLQQGWYVIYEHPDIPVPPPNTMIPEIVAAYSQTSEGVPQIVSAKLQIWG